tara:strand:+ start:1257 stop:1835 length:579 start_codon:yes stop_codon:yes gene_type:complete
MKSFLNEMEKKFKALEESQLCEECGMNECECVNEVTYQVKDAAAAKKLNVDDKDIIKVVDEDLEEASTTGGVAGYQTPNAFSKKIYDKRKKKTKWASVSEAMDKKYESLIESYSKFSMGNTSKSSPSKTVNETIRQVSKRLQEIETLINYTGRLKKESGMTRAEYGKSTFTALNKISERLLKISERIRSLGE